MIEPIEISIETADGIADCSLELHHTDDGTYYSVTILYPNIVNGFSRSEVYVHNMHPDNDGNYEFDPMDENIHPKIKKQKRLAYFLKPADFRKFFIWSKIGVIGLCFTILKIR